LQPHAQRAQLRAISLALVAYAELWSLALLCRLVETAWVNLLICLLCCGYATQSVKLSSAETKDVRRQRTALTGVIGGQPSKDSPHVGAEPRVPDARWARKEVALRVISTSDAIW
jgi:hypothetical protein